LQSSLADKRVAVPESRQLDILADLFERRGAHVVRVPLVLILDAPNPEPIVRWIEQFADSPPDYLILLTGEGLRRLVKLAEKHNLLDDFQSALSSVEKICRGPKPGRVLKGLGLKADRLGVTPTTEGIIETLAALPIEGKRIGLQLYGEEPNLLLQDYLAGRNVAVLPVAPYVYAPNSDNERVQEFIEELAQGSIDIVTFTSQPQFKRLLSVARQQNLEAQLFSGLRLVKIAVVGPLIRDQLQSHGLEVSVMPEKAFFMKPMVREIEKMLTAGGL